MLALGSYTCSRKLQLACVGALAGSRTQLESCGYSRRLFAAAFEIFGLARARYRKPKNGILIRMKKLVPWALLALFAAEIVTILLPKPDKDFHLQDFGRLPVLLNGRVQPFDSVGRNALLQIRSTASVPLEEKKSYEFWKHPKKLKATQWLMEAMMKPEVADTRPIFLIHHPDLLDELELRGKGKEKSGLFYFTFNELTNCSVQIDQEGQQVAALDPQLRTAYQKQVAKLHNALILYRRLKNSSQPEDTKDFAADLREFENSIRPGVTAVKAREAGKAFDQAAFDKFAGFLGQFDQMSRLAYPLIAPPSHPEASRDDWRNVGQVLFDAGTRGAVIPPAVNWLAQMSGAYRQDNPAEFNKALDGYRQWLAVNMPPELKKSRAEFFFNNLQAFLHAMIIYLCAFLLALAALLAIVFWPAGADCLRRSSLYLIILAWLVHTAGLVFRIVLEHRPPVTNLYSSAVFIGWIVILLGIVLEYVFRVGIAAAVASFIGFITLIIAHNLALGGDTMEMMRAVLDTNFWLTTHVLTITLGYAATFVAGFLGIVYVVLGLFIPILSIRLTKGRVVAMGVLAAPIMGPSAAVVASVGLCRDVGRIDIGQAMAKMVYGIICFATLFSFVGTVTGRHLGRPILGPVLGLGPEGKRRAHHCALERNHPARALGRHGARTRPDEPGHLRQHRHELLVVRREHAGRRPALLRFHGRRVQMADALHRQPGCHHRLGPVAVEHVEKFLRTGRGGNGRTQRPNQPLIISPQRRRDAENGVLPSVFSVPLFASI